jgi:MtN3 and saliva related transmembrane protein
MNLYYKNIEDQKLNIHNIIINFIDMDREEVADIIGYIGIIFLVFLLFPQIHKTHKVKHTAGMSLITVIFEVCLSICYLIYGILLRQQPLIIGNAIALIASTTLLSMFWYYPHKIPKQISNQESEQEQGQNTYRFCTLV